MNEEKLLKRIVTNPKIMPCGVELLYYSTGQTNY